MFFSFHQNYISLILYLQHMDTGPLSSPTNKGRFLDKVRQSNQAIQNGDFKHAITLYTEAINLDPINHILYSNRSAAHVKVGDYQKGLQDAVKARELNPKWAKVGVINISIDNYITLY
ncbi:unnamed protein product [Owenia fusiformis]|uniref:Uncharacterized protein n=1 Tax=Owenia fusiformis TaxID=6347 RepID=A0A8J1TKA2_OWEFU|nr:unnamed protein product [Owenia fusiformis]